MLMALWLSAILSGLVMQVMATATAGAARSRFRVTLLRADWAREACGALVMAFASASPALPPSGSIALGDGTSCEVIASVPGTKLDLNQASRPQLFIVLQDDSLVDALLDWRDADDERRRSGAERLEYEAASRRAPRNGPLGAVMELRDIRGFDRWSVVELGRRFTVRSAGELDATSPLAAALERYAPMMATDTGRWPAAAEDPVEPQCSSRPPAPDDGEVGTRHCLALTPSPARVEVRVVGRVQGSPAESEALMTFTRLAGRLALLRKEVQ